MESLRVRTGQISLNILDDAGESRGIFKFNPTDVECAKQLLALQEDFTIKQSQFLENAKTAVTPIEQATLLCELVDYFNSALDNCFGKGSSKILFGEAKTLSMYEDFFNGITPYYKKASSDRTDKYRKKK